MSQRACAGTVILREIQKIEEKIAFRFVGEREVTLDQLVKAPWARDKVTIVGSTKQPRFKIIAVKSQNRFWIIAGVGQLAAHQARAKLSHTDFSEVKLTITEVKADWNIPSAKPSNISAQRREQCANAKSQTESNQISHLPLTLTVDELAHLLRVNCKTVYDAIERQEIPGVRKVGRIFRISRDAIQEWLLDQKANQRSKGSKKR